MVFVVIIRLVSIDGEMVPTVERFIKNTNFKNH